MKLELIKQPGSECNVRYPSEKRVNGNIHEECNGRGKKTSLRVKVHGCWKDHGNLFVEASCVTKDDPHKPHVYQLRGENCYNGKYYARVNNTTKMAVFPNMNIMRIKKTELAINKHGYQGFNTNSRIDLTSFKLKFKIVRKRDGIPEFESIPHCPPFVSRVITNKRIPVTSKSIKIEKLVPKSCSIEGSEEVKITCSSPIHNKKNIIVKIYEARELDNVVQKNGILWESSGENICVYPKYTVFFTAPKYTGPSQMNKPIKVWVQLHQTNNSLASNLISFQYIPIKQCSIGYYQQLEPRNFYFNMNGNEGLQTRNGTSQNTTSPFNASNSDYHQLNISTSGNIEWANSVVNRPNNRVIFENIPRKHDIMMAGDTFHHTALQIHGNEIREVQDHASFPSGNEDLQTRNGTSQNTTLHIFNASNSDYHQPNISTFEKTQWQHCVANSPNNRVIFENKLINYDMMMAGDTFDHTGLQDANVTSEQNSYLGSYALSSTCSYHPSNKEEKKLENFGINNNSHLNNCSAVGAEMCEVHSVNFLMKNISNDDLFVTTGETLPLQNYIGNDNRYLTTSSSIHEDISNYNSISEHMEVENEVITSRSPFDATNYQSPPYYTTLHSVSNCQGKVKWNGDVKRPFRQRGC